MIERSSVGMGVMQGFYGSSPVVKKVCELVFFSLAAEWSVVNRTDYLSKPAQQHEKSGEIL
jgi:hypothetical protein